MDTLLTIPFSHYCEKARWALDFTGHPYEEIARLPIFHMLETVPRGGRSTPMLTRPDGDPLKDSTDILLALDVLYPEKHLYPSNPQQRKQCLELEDMLDRRFGPALRTAAYATILPESRRYKSTFGQHGSAFDQSALKVVWPLWSQFMKSVFKPSDTRFKKYSARMLEIFDVIADHRADGRTYLCGEQFSAADLTLAALSASLIAPPEYTNRLMNPEQMPDHWQAFAQSCRAHETGQYVLWLYAQHR